MVQPGGEGIVAAPTANPALTTDWPLPRDAAASRGLGPLLRTRASFCSVSNQKGAPNRVEEAAMIHPQISRRSTCALSASPGMRKLAQPKGRLFDQTP